MVYFLLFLPSSTHTAPSQDSALAGNGLEIFHQEEKVKRIGWARFELPVQVPLPSRLVLGVNQQRSNSRDVCRLCSAHQSVLEQSFAKTDSLMWQIHGKPGQDHHGDGVLRYAFDHSRGSRYGLDGAHGQAVEPDHLVTVATNVCLRAVGLLVDERETL